MSEESKKENVKVSIDFRAKQISELEQLQKVLDENNVLRSKFNSLQTQVAPLVDTFNANGNSGQYISDKVYSSEEVENMRFKLEQTLTEYRSETLLAGQLNSEIEKMYSELSSLKMHFRLDQDQRLNSQNEHSTEILHNFQEKTERVQETWSVERQRLEKQIGFLQKVFDSSSSDIKEFEEQYRTNNKGIQHLSSSITIAKEDIREFSDQLNKIEPRLKEYEELQKKHQQSEVLVVELSDQLESLKNQVETESLTANVRRQIDSGNKNISDLNGQIDKIICETSSIQEKSRELRNRISEYEMKLLRTENEIKSLKSVSNSLLEQKKLLQESLRSCRIIYEEKGGENSLLSKNIEEGICIDRPSWYIRKQILNLKEEVEEMEVIQNRQAEYENKIVNNNSSNISIPQRKRVPMIPFNH